MQAVAHDEIITMDKLIMTIPTPTNHVFFPLFGRVKNTTVASMTMMLVVVGVQQKWTEMENILIENGVFVPPLVQVNNKSK